MENLTSADPTGVVAKCVQELIKVGFDASAYEIAKWAGVACLIALFFFILTTFALRSLRDKDLPAALSEPQFRLTILIAAVLIALPVVAKVTSDQMNIELGSGDRQFAQRICDERAEALANDASIQAVLQRVNVLETQLALVMPTEQSMVIVPNPEDGSNFVQPVRADPLLGVSIAVFHRTQGNDTARQIEAVLTKNGAGVAVRETDLTESYLLKTALPGDIYIVYTGDASETVKTLRDVLTDAGITIKGLRGPFDLKGPSLQILVF